jgi:hypothetical protein
MQMIFFAQGSCFQEKYCIYGKHFLIEKRYIYSENHEKTVHNFERKT